MKKIFKNKSERFVKRMNATVQQILQLEDKFEKYSNEELKNQTVVLKESLKNGKTLDDILPIAYAVCREASWRVLKMKHFPVQIIGGIVLHQGRIAEMCTGEGKTLVATLPAYLNALTEKGVQIITVNDYLAKRDSEQMGKVFEFLGLTVGTVLQTSTLEQKKSAYACDITYCTNVELGFDYLRDNMVGHPSFRMQRPFNYCIIDEIDSILIDEARTPLIISGPGDDASEDYKKVDAFVRTLSCVKVENYDADNMDEHKSKEEEYDYIIDEKSKTAILTARGIAKAEKYFGLKDYTSIENNKLSHYINQSIKAHGVMKKDVDYIVRDGNTAIDIVDEFTGRVLEGRRFSDGLHQAIEVKEGIELGKESKTLATITYQNLFRLYPKLSGMTGTAMTEEPEFLGIYNIDVVSIPTNMPILRIDEKDALYRTEKDKYKAVVEEIKKAHKCKQPVLVGTTTVDKSEILSDMLKKENIPHNVLNAKHHEKEAQIIAQAGTVGNVTISTNMAGRGTDIMLGGNPTYLTKEMMNKMGYTPEEIYLAETIVQTDDEKVLKLRNVFKELYDDFKKDTDKAKKEVLELGGLYVIGTERHESRRIDNQLRGRSGRQGDSGRSKFFISFEDDLLRLFGGDKVKEFLSQAEENESVLMEGRMITNLVETAQKRIESNNFAIRKNVLEYDEVVNEQRKVIYSQRNQVIEQDDVSEIIINMMTTVVERIVSECVNEALPREEWDFEKLKDKLATKLLINDDEFEKLKDKEADDIFDFFANKVKDIYESKKERLGYVMLAIQKTILLGTIDSCWMNYVDDIVELRKGIVLRSYAQKKPIEEYKNETFDMFSEMTYRIKKTVFNKIIDLKIIEAGE